MDMRLGPVMTIAELSEYLRVPKSTLYKLAQEGKLPGQNVGRHWGFRKGRLTAGSMPVLLVPLMCLVASTAGHRR